MIEYGGVIIAACVSGVVISIGWGLNKTDKTSQYRQDWINGLREDISSLLSTSNKISVITQLESNQRKLSTDITEVGKDDKKYYADANESSKKRANELEDEKLILKYEFDRLLNLSLMRLNPTRSGRKDEENDLHDVLESALNCCSEQRFNLDAALIRSKTKVVLKNEWNKVKKPIWRLSILITILLMIISFLTYHSAPLNATKNEIPTSILAKN